MDSVTALLRRVGLFNSLAEEEFLRLAESAQFQSYQAGQTIVREGERGAELYIIAEGDVQVFTTGRQGQDIVLARLTSGEWFGEQALLPGRSDLRNASVRAFTAVRVLRLGKDHFQAALALDNPLKERLLELGAEQLRQNLLKQSMLFRSLDFDTGAPWTSERSYEDGEIVFREGAPSDAYYLITSGAAGVFRDLGGSPQLLVRLREGQGFGELGLLEQKPRGASVVAEGRLTVKVIAGERFLSLYDRSPELRDYIQTLRKVYVLPGRGFTTQHAGSFMGHEAITTVYHLADGRRVMASRVVGHDIYNMSVAGQTETATTLRFESTGKGESRELLLDGERLVGVTVQGSWDELGTIHQMLLDGKDLPAWQAAVFKERGSLKLEAEASFFEDAEVICACMQVTRGALKVCIERGCKAVEQLCEATGAGTVCGACVPRLKELVGREDWTPVSVTKMEDLAEGIRSFRLVPYSGEVAPSKPGQHIVVQAQIDGHWIQRAYTLTSPDSAMGYYEITVKREPQGLFSRWLFDQRTAADLVRVSSPQGNYYLDLNDRRPVVCLVAGIGMTPALAMARSLALGRHEIRFHMDYSVTSANKFVRLSELESILANHPNISLQTRVTSERGRITSGNVHGIVRSFENARFYVCGPTDFLLCMREGLLQAGVANADIHIEEFTPAGATPQVKGRPTVVSAALGEPEDGTEDFVSASVQRPLSIREEAEAYLKEFYRSKGVPTAFEARWAQVLRELEARGTYTQTYDELAFGAKIAWRNSVRCIGRLYWQGLQVRDKREVTDENEMYNEILEHIRLAQNGGNLRSVMTVFAPRDPKNEGTRIWNVQLCRYAGYRQPDGTVLGDPSSAEITSRALELGWKPKRRTRFDFLPVIIKHPGRDPKLFELPEGLPLEVEIEHPDYPWFKDLGLRWYGLPAVACMLLDLGGVQYTCAPFNGWYMGTEIGARNFSDRERYNMIPVIAQKMGLDTRRDRDLWKDRAVVELNIAVLHSYEKAGIKMVDHHTAAKDFMEFARQEKSEGRPVFARWSWVVPPISGSVTDVFHVEWEESVLKPNYFYMPEGWDQKDYFEKSQKISV